MKGMISGLDYRIRRDGGEDALASIGFEVGYSMYRDKS